MSGRRALAALVACIALLGARPHRAVTVFDLGDRVGKPAPDVTLALASGTALPLEALRGEPTYVFLFASWCEPCQAAIPQIRADYAKYGGRVHFVGVDVYEDAAAARAEIARDAFPFDVAVFTLDDLDAIVPVDTQLAAGLKYRIPTDVLIDANGVVRNVWRGVPVDPTGTPLDVLGTHLGELGIAP